jgi:transposase
MFKEESAMLGLEEEVWTLKEINRVSTVKQAIDGHITVREAAEHLQMSERQVWRLKRQVKARGAAGIKHGNKDRVPHNKLGQEERDELMKIFMDWKHKCDEGLNASHFCDILKRDHQIVYSRQTLWRLLKSYGMITVRHKRKHRTRRQRREQEGDILFLDGSPHRWFGEKYPSSTLLLCTDDATSKALWGIFVPEENRNGCFEVAYEVMMKYGIPRSFWLDRASQFITTRGKGVHVTQSELPTHWQDAMQVLGVRCMFASSPQARGRGERANGTFQGRLIAELQYRRIRTNAGGTKFLNEQFIPEYNKRFAIPAANPVSAWRRLPQNVDLKMILSARHERRVLNDNTVKHAGIRYQILKMNGVRTFAREKVEVQEWFDGSFHVVHPCHGDLKYEATKEFRRSPTLITLP